MLVTSFVNTMTPDIIQMHKIFTENKAKNL